MNLIDEPSIVEQAIAGDPGAFSQLLRAHDDAMRAVAYKMLGDQAAMDDVLQTAYLKAFRKISTFRADAAFGTWLHRIVMNSCYDLLRSSGRRSEVSYGEVPETTAPDSYEDRLATSQQLQTALQALSVEHRAVVLLVDGEGLSYGEAADTLGIERGTVASRLNRARSELRVRLNMTEENER